MKKLLLVAALGAGVTTAAAAQTPVPARDSAATPAPSAAQLAAAADLLVAMNMPRTLDESLNMMLRMQAEQNPMMAQMAPTMREFFTKYMGWNALKDQFATLYAATFTEREMRELAAFYRTPTGRKLALATPTLSTRGAEIGQKAVQEHLPELQQMMMAKMQAGAASDSASTPATTPPTPKP